MIKIFFSFTLFFCFSVYAKSIESRGFWLCTQDGAKGVRVRSLRIHQFPENNKCLGIYSRLGKDQIIADGKWFGFCQKMVNQVKNTLSDHLWNCKNFDSALFYYPDKKNPL